MTPTSALDKYCLRHGHFPTARIGDLTIMVCNGYIAVRVRSSGWAYITRPQVIRLIRWMTPLIRQMTVDEFDVEQAIRDAYEQEASHLDDLRQAKRARHPSRRNRRNRRKPSP